MENLVGRWTLESRGENFDDFMQCRQARWFLRNIINKFSADFEYSLSPDHSVFTKRTITSFRTGVYKMPVDTEFTPESTLSGRPEVGRITQTSGQKVIQEMRFKDTNEHAATIEHEVINDKLHLKLKCKNIVCDEVYNKVMPK